MEQASETYASLAEPLDHGQPTTSGLAPITQSDVSENLASRERPAIYGLAVLFIQRLLTLSHLVYNVTAPREVIYSYCLVGSQL